MAKFKDQQYLRAEHLYSGGSYRRVDVEIEDVLTDAPLQRRNEPVEGVALKFKGKDRVLGLGQTNESLCCVIFRDTDISQWIGKTLTLEVRRVRSARGGKQPAIRIMPPKGTELRSGLIKELGEPYEEAK